MRPGDSAFTEDEGTTDLAPGPAPDLAPSEMLNAALPFERNPALSRAGAGAGSTFLVAGPWGALDVTAHARLAARLIAAPHEAVEDLRALGLQHQDARAQVDEAVVALLDVENAAARAWNEAFERELDRHA